jgi:hypothetical protein
MPRSRAERIFAPVCGKACSEVSAQNQYSSTCWICANESTNKITKVTIDFRVVCLGVPIGHRPRGFGRPFLRPTQ